MTTTACFLDAETLSVLAEIQDYAFTGFQLYRKIATKTAENTTTSWATFVGHDIANGSKPSFDSLSRESINQLKKDGTHGEGRSTSEAEEIYSKLPDSFDSSQEVENFLTNKNFELGHDIPYSQGGSNGAENTMYMPKDLNRSIGDRRPTKDEIEYSEQAVIDESSFANNEYIEEAADFVLPLTGSTATRMVGLGLEAIGCIARNDQDQLQECCKKIPEELGKGVEDAFTRGAPAVIAEALLPGAAPIGWALKDLAEGDVQGFIGKAGLGIACTAFPLLGWGLAAYYAAERLSGTGNQTVTRRTGVGMDINFTPTSLYKRDPEKAKKAEEAMDVLFGL